MMGFVVAEGDVLTLLLEEAKAFARRCPTQYNALVECSAAVNHIRIDAGQRPIVVLAF
jgi:hypothetical protein